MGTDIGRTSIDRAGDFELLKQACIMTDRAYMLARQIEAGDTICDIDDKRHIGCVEAIHSNVSVAVKWLDSGWITELPIKQVRHIDIEQR